MSAIRMRKKPDLGYYMVSKLTVISRLESAGKFTIALAALKANPVDYEKWSAVSEIRSDDSIARSLFTAIGLDPDLILAKE